MVFFLHVFSQDIVKNALSFIRLKQAAFNLSMGGAGVASDRLSANYYYNPATLAKNQSSFFSAHASILSLDRRVYTFSYTQKLKEQVFFSIAWIHATVHNLYQFNEIAERIGDIDYGDNGFIGAVGFPINQKLSISLTIKYLSQLISYEKTYNANTVSMDIGIYYFLNEVAQFGLSFRDISREVSTNSSSIFEIEHREALPTFLILGLKSTVLSEWLGIQKLNFLTDYYLQNFKRKTIHIGLEYNTKKDIFFRIGIDDKEPRFGFGVRFSSVGRTVFLDYAFLLSRFGTGHGHIFSWVLLL